MIKTPVNEEISQCQHWLQSGHQVALATVVETWGSSPRPVGSHLAIREDGAFVGSVSGGCIEAAVITEALECIALQQANVLDFGVSDEQAWEAGLSCGGKIRALVVPISDETVVAVVNAAIAGRQAVATVTDMASGDSRCCRSGELDDASLSSPLREAIQDRFRQQQSGLLSDEQVEVFIRVYMPPMRMVIIGAVHIAQVLAPMALQAGFDVAVIDPRAAFCQPERFDGIQLLNDWPDEAMPGLEIDRQTAIITLTHDPKIDDPALQNALTGPAFYIGALGSRRTQEKRLQRIDDMGLSHQAHRIHGPVGLDLGGRSHAEIAVAILAEVIKERYSKRNNQELTQ